MADNVLESGPPSAKRPKLSSPALSASDGNGKYNACIPYLVIDINRKVASTVCVLLAGQTPESLQSCTAI